MMSSNVRIRVLKNLSLVLVAAFGLLVLFGAAPMVASAADPNYQVNVTPLPQPRANKAKIDTILTVVFSIAGVLSLLFVTLGGLRYVTSNGDAQTIAKAKNTVLYAIIGLVVSISAVAIVTFVLGEL